MKPACPVIKIPGMLQLDYCNLPSPGSPRLFELEFPGLKGYIRIKGTCMLHRLDEEIWLVDYGKSDPGSTYSASCQGLEMTTWSRKAIHPWLM
ncbi:hypothetical protein AcV5_007208 [Taiwanofungus camphoratus]|nr:hypothetical protein AcV5_007208 [Antrodia cinnamomea]